jgi:four helix bundle protein
MAKTFEELDSWNQAIDLDGEVYDFIMKSKLRLEYVLRDQMLRSAGSIADNVAEGFERGGNKEFIQYLYIAKGSCGELRSQFHRCKRRRLISETEFDKFYSDCRNLSGKLANFITYLKNSEMKGNKYKLK